MTIQNNKRKSEISAGTQPIKTNWIILTGGPCAGKTTTLEKLAAKGYKTVRESARMLIEQEQKKGRTLEQIRKNELEFQEKVLQMNQNNEANLDPKEQVFLERGIPDSIPYYQRAGGDWKKIVNICDKRIYKHIFILDQLPFEKDAIRAEDHKTAQEHHELLYKAYTYIGYKLIPVPVMPVAERVSFILEKIKNAS